jgi:hypothetical protein
MSNGKVVIKQWTANTSRAEETSNAYRNLGQQTSWKSKMKLWGKD